MRTRTRCTIVAVGAMVVSTWASADIVITREDGSAAPGSQASKTYNAQTGGWDIHLTKLYAPGGVTSYTIRANGGETIDNVWIDVPCWENDNGDCIPAGSPVFVYLYSDAPGGLRTVHNIEHIGTAETLLMHAEVTHDIGAVTVQTIGTLQAGRDVIGPVTATTLDNIYRGVEVVIAGRDVRGDVIATRGRIEQVQAGRHIGSAFNPVTVRGKFGHWHVHAEQDIHGEILAGDGGGEGYIAQLQCKRLFGTIRTPNVGSVFFDGRISITDQFQGAIIVGGSLADHVQYIQLPPNGLTGQIIINADNHPGGYWDAPVYLGPIDDPNTLVLSGPLYDLPSSVLGGGAIGVAPFRLHDQSCSPQNGASVTVAPGTPSPTVALQHYGPITWYFGSPVTIERRPRGSEAPYSTVPVSDFFMYRSDVNPTRLIIAAAPGKAGFQTGYDYRIRPTSQLRCDITGESNVQWLNDYLFSVQAAPQCMGDLNNDQFVDVGDMLLILAHWGPVGVLPTADITGDGVVGVDDLLQLLASWGACPSQQQTSGGTFSGKDAVTRSTIMPSKR